MKHKRKAYKEDDKWYLDLTKGKRAQISPETISYLCQWCWSTNSTEARRHKYNACRKARDINGKAHKVQMARELYKEFIGDLGDDEVVLHLNGDSLDMRLENLKKGSVSEKVQLSDLGKNQYIGVSETIWGTYRSQIGIGGNKYWLGSFKTAFAAALIRDFWCFHNHKYARLNFPEAFEK